MRGILMAAVLATAGCVANDAPACDEQLAVPGFELNVSEAPGLADATYTWSVTADGVTRTRDINVVGGQGFCNCAEASVTDPPAALEAAALSITMERGGAQLSLTDAPDGARRAGPSHIEIVLSRGGQQIASFTFDPTYRPVHDDCQSVLRAEYDVNVVGP